MNGSYIKTFRAIKGIAFLLFPFFSSACGQQPGLPDPLVHSNGHPVSSTQEWFDVRRGEVRGILEENQYGRIPETPDLQMSWRIVEEDGKALDGRATRKQARILFRKGADSCTLDLLLYLPNRRTAPAPVFLGINFNGNYTVCDDPEILLPDPDRYRNPRMTVDPARRGSDSGQWFVRQTLERGYGIATFFLGDLFEDIPSGAERGISPLLYPAGRDSLNAGFIGTGAWAMSRAVDYLLADPDVNGDQIIAWGLSRNGKTALWAGACDERFAAVISSSSGSGGASLYRGNTTETIGDITKRFPHWMCERFGTYDRPEELPFDQHMVLSLVAPRPLYVSNSDNDRYVKAKDEFPAVQAADRIYRFLGVGGLQTDRQPETNVPVGKTLRYHTKSGEHSVTLFDWECYWSFADFCLGKPE